MASSGEREESRPRLGPDVPAGSSAFDLPLGPLRVRVTDLPTPWDPFVPEHYAPFAERVDAARAPDLLVRCREGDGIVVPLPAPGGETVLDVLPLPGEGRFRIRSHWQDGTIDLPRREAELVLTSRAEIAFRMSLENFLRVAGQLMLIEHDAFLMHTAGILESERVYLLFGPSGAGKSTATLHSAPRPALSDDMVLLDLSAGPPAAVAVPFFGAFPPEERRRGRWPIAAALRLRQAESDELVPLSLARAVATVAASVPFVHELGVPHEGLTELVARLCRAVPVCDLHLRKGPGFWTLLEGLGRGDD